MPYLSVQRRIQTGVAPVAHEELGGYCTTGAPTKGTFVNDNSKARDLIDSTGQPAVDQPADTDLAAAGKGWKPRNVLFASRPVLSRPTVRLTALTVPASLLAAETTTQDADADGLLGTVVGGLANTVGTLFEQQPLLVTAMAVGLVGAGYLKLKGEFDVTREADGFAPKNQLRKALGARQLVKKRGVLRPSLADVPARKVDTNAVGTYLGKDRKTGLHLYMAIEDSSVMVAPPGAGKTAKLANWIIDAPGAVLATSVKVDIVDLTEKLRARVGRILIWNPQNIGGRVSNVAWDPVIGCSDPEHGVERAMRRANYLLDGSDATKGVENRSFWETASYSVLKSFLWAADAEGLTLLDVARWSKSFRNTEAIEILEKYEHPDPSNPRRPVAPRGWKDSLVEVQKVEGKPTTGENVFGTLSKTFMFLDSPQVQQVIEDAHKGGGLFDIRGYLQSQDTLYLLGRDTGRGGIGPLFSCLTGEIYEAARELAALQRGGRLDPPWSLILDEAALICSVPLEKWTADSRGLGIPIHAVFQSRSQIRDRYGREAAKTVWTNMVKLVLGGLADEEDLKGLSELCGRHKEKRESYSTSPGPDGTMRQSSSYTWVEVDTMTPADIMNLEPGEILVLRRNLGGPVVVRYTPVWERKDVKAVEKQQKKLAKSALTNRLRKDTTVPTAPVEAAYAEDPADLWAPPEPASPWAPAAPSADPSPWTADPAASGWVSGPKPGPRSHLQVVRGEVVPPMPEHPPVIPEQPDFAPTRHLEQVPVQPVPQEERPTAPVPLRKTGTDDTEAPASDPYVYDDDDDLGGL
ncbi:type IV secretory pathway, VirD4 component (plasmid) [Streptomyces hygroscopicus subsp. jinggangensis 5008]|nr:type IV secretory pathway, VirD4 component [Streptomyces hygroscopicus subsp. jinggangensis 5008]AGF68501.1 type IV secretory pathway, VirD4 component [Streptomyces hygroscopicus subsp. jinggangensis TL01]